MTRFLWEIFMAEDWTLKDSYDLILKAEGSGKRTPSESGAPPTFSACFAISAITAVTSCQASKIWQHHTFWCIEQTSVSLPGFPDLPACRNVLHWSDTRANLEVCVEVDTPGTALDQQRVEALDWYFPLLPCRLLSLRCIRQAFLRGTKTELWLPIVMIRSIKYARIGFSLFLSCFNLHKTPKPPVLFLRITSPNLPPVHVLEKNLD